MANSWYAYLGQGKDPLVPTSYRRMSVKPLCITGIGTCAVYLGETSVTPTNPFSSNILTYITNALASLGQQPVDSTIKAFVYNKD